MNELMNELKKLQENADKQLAEIETEFEELDKEGKLSSKDMKRLSNLANKLDELKSFKETLAKDIDAADELNAKIEERKAVIAKTSDDSIKLIHQDKLDELLEKQEMFEAGLMAYYKEDLEALNTPEETVEETEQSQKKGSNSGKVAVSIVALLAAAGLGFGAAKIDLGKITNMIHKNEKPETTTEQNIDEVSETSEVAAKPEVVAEESKEIEITEELVYEVAEKSANEINANLPGYGMTTETMAEMIKWINGLEVEEATLEAQRAYIGEFLTLLANDTNAKEVFDCSQLFLTPNANRLVNTMMKVRKDAIDAIGTEKTEEVADELTELLTKMTKHAADKDGDKLKEVVALDRLEKTSQKFFAVQLFGSTYAKLDNIRNGVYVDKDGFEYHLTDFEAMNTESYINYEKVTNIGTAGDGCEYETLDYISYLGQETLLEAQELKEAIANGYAKSLTK